MIEKTYFNLSEIDKIPISQIKSIKKVTRYHYPAMHFISFLLFFINMLCGVTIFTGNTLAIINLFVAMLFVFSLTTDKKDADFYLVIKTTNETIRFKGSDAAIRIRHTQLKNLMKAHRV